MSERELIQTMTVLAAWVLLAVIFHFNLYKIGHFLDLMVQHGILAQGYHKIYLWMRPGQVSSSPLLWLLVHLIVASSLLLVSVVSLIWPRELRSLKNKLHWTFLLITVGNLFHSGEFVWWLAILQHSISFVPLIVAHQVENPWLYFFALASSPGLEAILYVRR